MDFMQLMINGRINETLAEITEILENLKKRIEAIEEKLANNE